MFATCFRYTVSYFGRREKFHAPLLKSVIDTVVFGHDLDFSNDKTCNETFKAVARAARGRMTGEGQSKNGGGLDALAKKNTADMHCRVQDKGPK